MFYRINRAVWATLWPDARQQGLAIMAAAMDPQAADAPARLQSFVVAGTKPISVLSRWMAIR